MIDLSQTSMTDKMFHYINRWERLVLTAEPHYDSGWRRRGLRGGGGVNLTFHLRRVMRAIRERRLEDQSGSQKSSSLVSALRYQETKQWR